ncbi:ornithine carbamoyltransferase [Dehalococcoidia bacterium]|nr:ornithine carbamoyltransferase [Dehalococcoidia bacterium]
MNKRNLLSITDLSPMEVNSILRRAIELKQGAQSKSLTGKAVALLFEKPSLRTKVSFDVAIHQLGGHAIYLSRDEIGLGNREAISDVARVLSGYVDAIVARTYSHQTLEELAAYSSVPVVNALSNIEHPCQALGDLLTIKEQFGKVDGVTIAFVGDGNNVATSLALGAASTGANFVAASPPGYQLDQRVIDLARQLAAGYNATIRQVTNPREAAQGSDVVYTDVWVSMGQEMETEKRQHDFQGYQVNHPLMQTANPKAIFMHPLPAHHCEEISQGMLEHPQSVVFEQSENRLHAQKSVLELLLR